MRTALLFLFLSLPVQGVQRGANPAFRLYVEGKTGFCEAIGIASGKSERCFAATARACIPAATAEIGSTTIRSGEFGEHKADFFVTPGDAVLLAWKCGGGENNVPSHYLWDQKISAKADIACGKGGFDGGGLSGCKPGESDTKQTTMVTSGYKLTTADIGGPLLCDQDLCGILVSPERSRYATGEAIEFMRAKMRSMGVVEPKFIYENGKRFRLVQP